MTMATVTAIWRYPIKGIMGEKLTATTLLAGRGIAHDRRWLLAVDDEAETDRRWRPWKKGLSMKSVSRLAKLSATVGDGGDTLIIRGDGDSVCGCPSDAAARKKMESFLRDFLDDSRIRLQDCESRPVWDYDGVHITLLNVAGVAELAEKIGVDISPLRFRANIFFGDAAAGCESSAAAGDLEDSQKNRFATIGDAKLLLMERVTRCAATTVNPVTAARDINIPQQLMRFYGRNKMGVKTKVTVGGDIAVGEKLFF